MELNTLFYKVRGAIFAVFNELGPGLLESVDETALCYELNNRGLFTKSQVGVPITYKEVQLDLGFKIDLLVEDKIIIEIKSIEALHKVRKKNNSLLF